MNHYNEKCLVPEWHWAQVEEILLIHKKNLYDYWWPNLEIFQKHNIPIYRLVQKPGDILWIQSGSITWGHALGWCNSIMVNYHISLLFLLRDTT